VKILYTYFHNYDDMPYHTREWVEAAIGLGHDVKVVTIVPPEFLKKIGWSDKIHVIQVPRPRSYGVLGKLFLLVNYMKVLSKTAEDFQPELVYERFSFVSIVGATLFARGSKINYCIELNGIPEDEARLQDVRSINLNLKILKIIEGYIFKRTNRIITVTERIRRWAIDKYQVASSKVKFIPNGVNTERFKLHDKILSRRKFGIPENAFILGYLGSLFPWQDFDLLIESAKKLKKEIPELIILIGGGQEPWLSEIRKKISDAGINDYALTPGQIHWDEAPQFISCFDVAVSLLKKIANGYEFSPQKTVAYLSCSVPVISSAVPGELSEVIARSKLGKTFIPENADDFKKAVSKLYASGQENLKKMGADGRIIVMQKYTWNKVVSETLEFIQQ